MIKPIRLSGIPAFLNTLIARIQQSTGEIVQMRSPLPGKIHKVLKAQATPVAQGEEVLSLNSDENSIWEALRGLAMIGTADESAIIQSYATSSAVSTRIRDQANLTLKAIQTQ